MNIRQPVRAGSFYEAAPDSCRLHADKLLDSAGLGEDLPAKCYGGLVPHAGWTYSGRIAAKTFKALTRVAKVETIILLGADHHGTVRVGEVYDSGVWRTPLGEIEINNELGQAIIDSSDLLRSNPAAHQYEHSIEVQVPLIQAMDESLRILPIAVPPADEAVQIGAAIGKVVAEKFPTVAVVGSSDLTHHGGHFPSPGGHGSEGAQWSAKNDRRMLDLIENLSAEKIVPESQQQGNACGAGAIAAAIAACREMGATQGMVLEYTNSYEIMHERYPDDPDDTTVGYASVIFA